MGHRRPRKNARSRLCQPTQDRQDSARISARNVSRPRASSRPRRVSRSIEQHHQGSLFAVPFRDRAAAFAIMPSMASGLRTGCPACRPSPHRTERRSNVPATRHRQAQPYGHHHARGAVVMWERTSSRYPANCRTGRATSRFLIVFIRVFILAHRRAADGTPVVCPPSRKPVTKQAKNRPNETILRKPRNHPETDGA